MATWGEFASLLQLGFGVGVGLSVFRAPVDLRTNKLAHILDDELAALRGVTSDFGRAKRRALMSAKLRFFGVRDTLEREQMPFMVLAVMGAAANLACLIWASMRSTLQLDNVSQGLIVFISVGYFSTLAVSLEVIARIRLSSLIREVSRIKSMRAMDT